ncbi:MAG: hypothetical protein ACQEXJ_03770 [Myxococcota bacterium]
MRRFITVVSTAVALGLTASAAQAVEGVGTTDPRVISPGSLGAEFSGLTQAGMGLPRTTPKYGLRAGEFIIQPRFFVEGAYTSNFFRVDTRDETAEEEGVFSLHLRPGLAVFNPEYDKVSFKLGVDANVLLPFSDQDRVTKQKDVGLEADARVALFPKGALTLTFADSFNRQLWMRPAIGTDNGNRNHNELGADLSFHPGGGALEFKAGYRWGITRYDDLDDLDADNHQFDFLASWRFYPLSYAFLESNISLFEYSHDATAAEEQSVGNYVPGTPLRVYLGISGYLTERFALVAKAGYGNSMLEDEAAEDFNSAIGQLQATFRFTPKTAWHIGGERNYETVVFGGYYSVWRAYTSLEQNIGDVVLLHMDFSYDHRRFGPWQPAPVEDPQDGSVTTPTASDDNRVDPYLRGGVLLDFNISRLFGTSLGYRYTANLTDFTVDVDGREAHQGYDEHRIFATINLRY